jgi:hypothetical protein
MEPMAFRKVLAAICIAVMVVGGIGVTLYLLTNKDLSSLTQPTRSSASLPPGPSVPTPEEFKVGIDVTGQNCPEAGKCIYTYSVSPNYVGNHPLPEQAFTVFYEVRGGFASQDGTITVSDGQARMLKDVQIEGPQGAQLEVVVTQISAVAGPKPVS